MNLVQDARCDSHANLFLEATLSLFIDSENVKHASYQ